MLLSDRKNYQVTGKKDKSVSNEFCKVSITHLNNLMVTYLVVMPGTYVVPDTGKYCELRHE